MIEGLRVLAVVPARGGSKGIPLKNLREIKGVSLVEMAAKVALQVREIDRCIVSTDHQLISTVAKRAGLDAPFLRPSEISGDKIGDYEVLQHALLKIEEIDNVRYDIIVMLQPTSPLRNVTDVTGVIKMLVDERLDSVWSVSETDTKAHPYKQLKVNNGLLSYWDERGAEIIARQQLDKTYHRNGVAYAIVRDCLINQKTIRGNRSGAYIVTSKQISIDTESDIALVNCIIDGLL